MKLQRYIILMTLALGIIACNRPPELPIEPEISFSCLNFREVPDKPTETTQDSLIIEINFQDGDGDLGLGETETHYPYNNVFYFIDEDEELVTLSYRTEVPGYDTLPPFEFPYTCTNWVINPEIDAFSIVKNQNGELFETTNAVDIQDTVYYEENRNHFNIFVEYFVKRNGVFEEFDWVTEIAQCGESFNGRFPILSDISEKPLEGTLRYSMTSSGFLFLFRHDTLKLRIGIQDRQLHKSNVIETPEFTLRGVKDSGC